MRGRRGLQNEPNYLGAVAKDPRPDIAGSTRQRASTQRAVDIDRSARDDLSARSDRTNNGDIALYKDHGLAGAHRVFDHERCRLRFLQRAGRGDWRGHGNYSTGSSVLIVRSIVIASAVEQMLEYGEIKFASI